MWEQGLIDPHYKPLVEIMVLHGYIYVCELKLVYHQTFEENLHHPQDFLIEIHTI